MPELPEVETVVRELRPQLVGRRLRGLRVSRFPLRREWSKAWAKLLHGRKVSAVRRRGKWIILDLHEGAHLVLHLGMTGQLTVKRSGAPLDAHTHLIVDLDRGQRQLRFRDIRRFGSATVFKDANQLEAFLAKTGLGPEPFDVPASYWRERLAGTNRCLKAVLLDQRVVAGIGNIYADEALFQAHLHPTQIARDTGREQAARLQRAVVHVLKRAIDCRGSSIRDYVGGSGRKGEYQNEFLVYGRAGQPCPRCHTAIERIRLAGRSTHFCPHCQKPARANVGISAKRT